MSAENGAVHIYSSEEQPATLFVDSHSGRSMVFSCHPRRLSWTDCCRKRRWAKYVVVKVYYDTVGRFCAKGHGCQA